MFSMTGTDANKQLVIHAVSALKNSDISVLFNLGGTVWFRNGKNKNEHIHVPSGDNMLRTVARYVCEEGWTLEEIDRDPDVGILNVTLSKDDSDPCAGVVFSYAAQ